MHFEIVFAEVVEEHLKRLTANERAKLFDAIERHLKHEPLVETRNRKPLRPNPIAPWELRVGNLRVLYDVSETGESEAKGEEESSTAGAVVEIIVVGEKKGQYPLRWR